MAALNIIRGSDRSFIVRVAYSEPDNSSEVGEPFPLTGSSEISISFPKSDGAVLTKTLTGGAVTILNANTGKLKVWLSTADTASLKTGEGLSFELKIVIASVTSIVQFLESLNVIDDLFP
jgi:hypothetical protein